MKFADELHEPETRDGKTVCKVCGRELTKKQERQYCTGKGWYARWGDVPEHLKSVGQWKKLGYRPLKDAIPRAQVLTYMYGHGHFWADLWEADQVVPVKTRTKVRG